MAGLEVWSYTCLSYLQSIVEMWPNIFKAAIWLLLACQPDQSLRLDIVIDVDVASGLCKRLVHKGSEPAGKQETESRQDVNKTKKVYQQLNMHRKWHKINSIISEVKETSVL